MITSNVIHRVFRIRNKDAEATAFAMDVDQRQYLVTAKHVVANLSGTCRIEVFGNGAWTAYDASVVGHASGDRDVSVLTFNQVMTPASLLLPATSDGVIYGQDVFFLGFPYGFTGKYVFGEDGRPLPFVKKATVSLLDEGVFLLDGHNNPGFSGGPVVCAEPGSTNYRVFGVISGYRAVDEPVYAGGVPVHIGPGQPVVSRYNTGIIVTCAIDYAVELARKNPIGIPVSTIDK